MWTTHYVDLRTYLYFSLYSKLLSDTLDVFTNARGLEVVGDCKLTLCSYLLSSESLCS
jgi:hypothetical protein